MKLLFIVLAFVVTGCGTERVLNRECRDLNGNPIADHCTGVPVK